jgi:hypothetical protein
MKYEVGNNYGVGRPKGSPNKTTAETKELISELVFNREEFTTDWKHMNAHERMEIRIKLAKFIIPEPKEAPLSRVEQDYPLFIDTMEDKLRLQEMTENGAQQAGGSIEFI